MLGFKFGKVTGLKSDGSKKSARLMLAQNWRSWSSFLNLGRLRDFFI